MRALCAAGAACVHYLAGKESINISGKCHSGLARQEISKIYACCPCSMRRKTTSLTVLPVLLEFGIPMGKTNEFAYYQSRRMPLEYVLNLQIGPAYIALLSRITRF